MFLSRCHGTLAAFWQKCHSTVFSVRHESLQGFQYPLSAVFIRFNLCKLAFWHDPQRLMLA